MAYAAYWMRVSQGKQSTPTPAVPVSTVKPAEYEKGATSSSTAGPAAQPGTTAPSAVTTAVSAVPVSTTATVSAGASTGAKFSGGVSTGGTISGAGSNLGTQTGSCKVTPQTSAIAPAKAPPVSAGSGAASGKGEAGATGVGVGAGKPTVDPVKLKDASKDKAQSTITTSTKSEPSKVASTGMGGTAKKDETKSNSAKVQKEVPPPSTKATVSTPDVDPFDALAGSLQPSEPLAPKAPLYTGPEVKEPGLTSEEAIVCGKNEWTLPPGYRLQDMEKKIPTGKPDKPKEVSKPLTDDDALDSLSAGFVSSAVPSAPKSQMVSQTPPISSAKAPPVSASGTVSGIEGVSAVKATSDPIKSKDVSKDKGQSAAISSFKLEPSKVTSTGVDKPTSVANVPGSTAQKDDTKSKGTKVQSEVPPPTAKASIPTPAVDPFDALAGSLSSQEPLAPKAPQYSGPEVIEPSLTPEVANRCGDRDSTLPPGFRNEDMEKMSPVGIPDKPKEVSKPSKVEDAVNSLSAGFVSSAVPKPEAKAESVTAAQSKYAPPPAQKRQEVPVPTNVSPAPPADKKAKVEKDNSMSLDALSALEDTLPSAKPAAESPKLRPEDIVNEKQATSEKGVRVGEREGTIPPEYRFSEDKLKERPAPPKEPSMDSAEALDILCGDFTSPSLAPAVQAPVPPSAPAKKQHTVEDLSALETLTGDFVAPAQSKKVASGVPPPAAKSTLDITTDEGDPMSLDALSALGDTLPTAKPVPESPKLRPEDIVDEKKLTSEKGVRVGEREDTLPPDYRFSKEELQKYPAQPKREPSLDSAAALDILSGDFTSPSVGSAVQAPVPPSAPPAESSEDFALEELADDFVAPIAASKVHSTVKAPPKPDRQLSEGTTSAMDALSDTLMDIGQVPEPVPVSPKDIVKEKQAVEEKVTKPGERDDSLPPEYRPTEADIKAAAEAKAKTKAGGTPKQISMDESAALDVLSSDFSTPAVVTPAVPVAKPPSHSHASPAKTPPTNSVPKAPGPVLDKLATTLLPDLPEAKPKESKAKVKGGKSKSKPKKPAVDDVPATGNLSGQPSTDVVSTSPAKKAGKS